MTEDGTGVLTVILKKALETYFTIIPETILKAHFPGNLVVVSKREPIIDLAGT